MNNWGAHCSRLGVGIVVIVMSLSIVSRFSLQGIPVVKIFVARNAKITRLTQALLPTSTDQMRRKLFILHGLGGIGKTQISVEFTRKYQGSYSAVFWIDGLSKKRLRRSIADLASRLPQHQLSEGSSSSMVGNGRAITFAPQYNAMQVAVDARSWRSVSGWSQA